MGGAKTDSKVESYLGALLLDVRVEAGFFVGEDFVGESCGGDRGEEGRY